MYVEVEKVSPNCDQHQISPRNISAYSTPEVMRIKDMITQGRSWYFNNPPPPPQPPRTCTVQYGDKLENLLFDVRG